MARDRFLVVIGCQKTKLDAVDKKFRKNILDFINSTAHTYTGVISVVRTRTNGDRNFVRSGDTIAASTDIYLDYESNNIIEVPGYDVDVKMFRADAHYDIIGISTSASVLCVAMSMYSQGLDISVLSEYCQDRKGPSLHKYALEIMNAYMPECVK